MKKMLKLMLSVFSTTVIANNLLNLSIFNDSHLQLTNAVVANERNFDVIKYILDPIEQDYNQKLTNRDGLLEKYRPEKIAFDQQDRDFLIKNNNYLRQKVDEDAITARKNNDLLAELEYDNLNEVSKMLSKNKTTKIDLANTFSVLNAQKQKNIQNFFGKLSFWFSPTTVNQIIGQIFYHGPDLVGTPIGFANIEENMKYTYTVLSGKEIFDDQENIKNYQTGLSSTASPISILSHEIAHLFSLYASLDDSEKAKINKNNDMDIEKDLIFGYPEKFVQTKKTRLGSTHFFEWIGKKYHFKDKIDQILFTYLLAPNRYGTYETSKLDLLFDEYFAEAFNAWLWTPNDQLDYGWGILNQYFTTAFRDLLG